VTWYLPQHELPGKDLISGPQLYARRERVFLVLVAIFVAASAALPLLGVSRLYGVTSLVRRIGIEPPVTLLVALGAFAFPLALLALNVVGALFGRRRAWSLLLAGLVVNLGVLGLHYGTDNVLAYDRTKTSAFLPGVALCACVVVTCAVQIEAFALLRRNRLVRGAASTLVGLAAGWGVAALLFENIPITINESFTGIALASAGFDWLAVVAGSIVLGVVVSSLATYLRFPVRERGIDDYDDEPAFVGRKQRAEIIDD
jgi:uncharacterized PurR-regulated membrane protein YhhQ (DUF165 family)